MGFTVRIESNNGEEILSNYPSGGKAVLSFLTGLKVYCILVVEDEIRSWYADLEQQSEDVFCTRCHELLKSMWGDGGDTTVYRQDEWEVYKQRNPQMASMMTEESFKAMVTQYWEAFQPTEKVRDAIQFLLQLFKDKQPEALEGFYRAEDSIPDFEALLANLELLIQRGSLNVRLNFS